MLKLDKRNNFGEGTSEPMKDAQVIQVWERQPHEFFLTRVTCLIVGGPYFLALASAVLSC